MNLDYSQYRQSRPGDLSVTEAEKIQQFYSLLTTSIDVIRNFADKIPGFTDLAREDQVRERARARAIVLDYYACIVLVLEDDEDR